MPLSDSLNAANRHVLLARLWQVCKRRLIYVIEGINGGLSRQEQISAHAVGDPLEREENPSYGFLNIKKETGGLYLVYPCQLDSGSNEGPAPFSSSLSATPGKSVNTRLHVAKINFAIN